MNLWLGVVDTMRWFWPKPSMLRLREMAFLSLLSI